MQIWGDYYAGECVHGEPALRCRTCGPDASRDFWSSPVALLLAVLLVAGLMFAAPSAWRREAAFERQQLTEHQQRLETARPGAMANLRAMAKEQR